MNGLVDLLIEEIGQRGPITFAEYMARALYDPAHGYYAQEGAPRTGRSGDFVTSPEMDAAFGALWTIAFRRVWDACGRPDEFHLVEIGPGEGGFAKAVLAAARDDFGRALRYVMVEPRAATRTRQKARLEDDRLAWAGSLNEIAVDHGCVFANEVLDNQPVHLLRPGPKGFAEVYVDATGGALVLKEGPPSSGALTTYLDDVGLKGVDAPMQIGLAAAELVKAAARSIEAGALVFVDYGLEASELLERGGNTVVTYSARGARTDPLAQPGSEDITAHVDWTGVRRALERAGSIVEGPVPQAEVLRSLGISGFDARLKEDHDEAVSRGDGPAAVRLLSRRNAVGALTNTGGLGGLGVLSATKGLGSSLGELLR